MAADPAAGYWWSRPELGKPDSPSNRHERQPVLIREKKVWRLKGLRDEGAGVNQVRTNKRSGLGRPRKSLRWRALYEASGARGQRIGDARAGGLTHGLESPANYCSHRFAPPIAELTVVNIRAVRGRVTGLCPDNRLLAVTRWELESPPLRLSDQLGFRRLPPRVREAPRRGLRRLLKKCPILVVELHSTRAEGAH